MRAHSSSDSAGACGAAGIGGSTASGGVTGGGGNASVGEYVLSQTVTPGAAVSGRVFNDLTGSGQDLGSDPALAGWTITLTDTDTNQVVFGGAAAKQTGMRI